jgi:ectoine hydroxylase-related dioxygenase (phytanoyl-CoA dioxygenase family)
MPTLTSDQVDFYDENGYLLFHDQLLPPEKLRKLTSIFEEHLADKGDKLSDELDTPHFRDPRLLEFLLAGEVLDLVEPIVGPNIALWSSHFISKDPHTGRATPWHEDSSFWEGRLSAYDRMVTVWLAIDPSTRENGCMRVLPGSQKLNRTTKGDRYRESDRADNTFAWELKEVDQSNAVYFELERGECSLHDARMVHGAEPNTSSQRRCGYTMRYFPASVKVYPEKNEGFKIWLARGEDLAGNTLYANA